MKKFKILTLIVFTISLVGCGIETNITDDYVVSSGGAYRNETKLEQNEQSSNETNADREIVDQEVNQDNSKDNYIPKDIDNEVINNRANKILSILNITAETIDLDNDVKRLEKQIHDLSGYVKSHKIKDSVDKKYARIADISIRIPKNEAMKLINYIKEDFIIIDESSETVDITETYFDLELNIRNLEKQEEHLLNMYELTTNIEDMLKINDRLTEVSKEKIKLTLDYSDMKDRMDYSIIEISINEISDTYGLSVGEKIQNNFYKYFTITKEFIDDIIVIIVSSSPLIIILIPLFIMYKRADIESSTEFSIEPMEKATIKTDIECSEKIEINNVINNEIDNEIENNEDN